MTDVATGPSQALLPKFSSTAADLLEAFSRSFNLCTLVYILTSHHITSHHITSHHITSHHITSHHTTPHHIAGGVYSHKVGACMLLTLTLIQTGYIHVLWVAMVRESQGTSHQLLWQLLRMIHQFRMF
jgi:hypothetical protein